MTDIDKVISIAREVKPDLWERTDQIARIIDPGSFGDGYVVSGGESKRLFESRRKYMQAVAMNKAQEVLKFLGVNTDTDWLEILTRLSKDDRD